MITKEIKNNIIEEYKTHEGDTGSPEVQVAILTYNQRFERAPEGTPQGFPFQKRSAEDGRSEKKSAEVSEGYRYRKIQKPDCSSWPQKIVTG